MLCKSCTSPLPESSKFCPNCGTPVSGAPVSDAPPGHEATRPSVDGFALIRNYIPKELAERILAAGKQIESERRMVTVLFADVTGFTALSEKLDLEDVSAVLNDCFSGLISIILKYEGTIDKFIGDGIMAIFGAPLAHENDPERAVRCALEMMAEIENFNRQSNGAPAGGAAVGFAAATDLAEYLALAGVPFRQAHHIVGRIVRHCIERGKDLPVLTLEELRDFSPKFGPDALKVLTAAASVRRKRGPGSTAPAEVRKALREARRRNA